jgi:hypothetical protein
MDVFLDDKKSSFSLKNLPISRPPARMGTKYDHFSLFFALCVFQKKRKSVDFLFCFIAISSFSGSILDKKIRSLQTFEAS